MSAACTCEPSAFCPTHGAEGWRDDPVRVARDALRRVQTGRVWFEPYSDALNPIVEAIKALDKLAGLDNVRRTP